MKKFLIIAATGLVAGCSGGGSDKVYVALNGTGTTPLASSNTGANVQLDRDTNTLTYNGDVGQINAAGDTVTFASGATMSLSGLDNDYSRLFVLSGASPTFGAYGVNTARADVPSGSASYYGDAILVVTAPEGVFDLTGDASAEVDFGSREASLRMQNLSGTRFTGTSAPETVDDFGTIAASDIELSSSRLSDGTFVVTTSETSAFDGAITGDVEATLFGPDAEEIGGSITVSGDAAAIIGGFIAKQ